jgi:hypothetical protein
MVAPIQGIEYFAGFGEAIGEEVDPNLKDSHNA